MKIARRLFYLLLILLPVQLGPHFFLPSSLLGGIVSDYLAPTFYLTDLVILLIILFYFISYKPQNREKNLFFIVLFVCLLIFLLLSDLFVARNLPAALYKTVKIVEFILLGFTVVKLKIDQKKVALSLALGLICASFIGLAQFFLQRSVGGFLWFLGERTFSAGTPGIAAASFPFFNGLVLRSYSTFPHPNVFAGFLALTLTFIIGTSLGFSEKSFPPLFTGAVALLGFAALIVTFSRTALFVFIFGLVLLLIGKKSRDWTFLKKNTVLILSLFYFSVFVSIFLPLVLPSGFLAGQSAQSLNQRTELLRGNLSLVLLHPLTGVGLNNTLVRLRDVIPLISDLFLLQPVHNIYLLVLSETGLPGFIIFVVFLSVVLCRSARKNGFYTVLLLQLYFLGLFDHYLLTLHQGELLFTVFISLAVSASGLVF